MRVCARFCIDDMNGLSVIFEIKDDLLELIRVYEYTGERNDKNNYLFSGHNRPSPKQMANSFLTARRAKFRMKRMLNILLPLTKYNLGFL